MNGTGTEKENSMNRVNQLMENKAKINGETYQTKKRHAHTHRERESEIKGTGKDK